MSEERPFAPRSPLMRKPKRSCLLVWVLACFIVGTVLIVLADRYLPEDLKQAGRFIGAVLTPVFWMLQAWSTRDAHYRKLK
ncbi:MAG: hypothetical protein Q8L23_07860 [Caulobacter sp.]|nr:hypothetical protein [Caulobacter sp.]